MSDYRINTISLCVGNRGTGKTDFSKDLAANTALPKTLIVDTFDNSVWRNMKTWNHPEWVNREIPIISPDDVKRHQYGIGRTFDSDTDKMQRILAQDVSNTFVIVEDASRYFESKLTVAQRTYLLNSKQTNVDFHLVFHYLTDIAPRLVKMADYITIFKTDEFTFDEKKFHHPEFRKAFNMVKNSRDPHAKITLKLR